jgi:hypothetical protein
MLYLLPVWMDLKMKMKLLKSSALRETDSSGHRQSEQKEQAWYSSKDKRVFSDMQSAMSSEQHAAAIVMAENDMSIAKLKVDAQQKVVEKLSEGNLAVQCEASKAVLATSIRETAAELWKEDPSLGVLQSTEMAKEALSEFS